MVEEHLSKPDNLMGLYLRNYAANFCGNVIIFVLNFFTPLAVFDHWKEFQSKGGWIMIPVVMMTVFSVATVVQYLIQRPIAVGLRQIRSDQQLDGALWEKAGRRLLNLPSIIGLANLALWVGFTCLFLPILSLLIEITVPGFFYGFFRMVMIGLIASFISFFLIDAYSRKTLVPVFFPEGKLAALPGTIKISILRRIRVLFGAGTNAPMALLVGTLGFAVWEVQDYAVSAGQFGIQVLAFTVAVCVIFICISLILNFLAGRSILEPIKEMMGVVAEVRDGNFRKKVRVVSNDELGILGDGMNEMTTGLIEREHMRRHLNLAKEVQQALLPATVPIVKGLDIAARSIYCDETGGDYYDFFGTDEADPAQVSVVVGDVSGHGVASALLMATVRAFLRQRATFAGSLDEIVSDVNRLLIRDLGDSGRFMTLFYLTIDGQHRWLNWVRAGHDPAIFYDPLSDTFEELRGSGMVLGIAGGHAYEQSRKDNLAEGQIIVLGTDGIWEARNSAGEMFGKDALCRIIRQYADVDANGLLTACLYALEKFQGGARPEDDVTLIVIKIAKA